MTFSQRTLAALAAVAVLALGATNAQAIFIDFGGAPVGTITVNVPPGNNINTATQITMPSGFTVTTLGVGDASGLALNGTFNISPTTWTLSPSVTTLTKTWTGNGGTYTETLTSLAIDRSVSNSLTLNYSGTLSGPNIVGSQNAFLEVSFTQAGGPGAGISATLTETSFPPNPIPEPSTVVLAGLGALGLIGYGLRRRKAIGA
jgi:hypothetical protein